MKAFAVFTRHKLAEIAWQERGYVFVRGDDGRTMFAGIETPSGDVVRLHFTCGSALGTYAEERAAEVSGWVLAFDNGRDGFPSQEEAFDAIRSAEAGGATAAVPAGKSAPRAIFLAHWDVKRETGSEAFATREAAIDAVLKWANEYGWIVEEYEHAYANDDEAEPTDEECAALANAQARDTLEKHGELHSKSGSCHYSIERAPLQS